MTTETLKPFIPVPRCVDNSASMHSNAATSCKRSSNLWAIILSALAVILTLVLLGLAMWQFQRITKLENNTKHLDKVILSMQKRLGLTNLDDLGDYGKEYNNNVLIDEPTILVDDDDDDDDDDNGLLIDEEDDEDIDDEKDEDEDEEFDYEEFRKKLAAMNYDDGMDDDDDDDDDDDENEDDIVESTVDGDAGEEDEDADSNSEDEEDIDVSDDGDLYNDFSKFNATRKKKANSRKSRAIAPEEPTEELEKNAKLKKDQKTSTNENQSKANNQQRKMLMLRLPSQRSEVAIKEIERKTAINEQTGRKSSHRRHMDNRRYKNGMVKNGASHFISAKSARLAQVTTTNTPAAHFHLNRKVPDRYASIRVDSYSGDMYIGHPSWPNEIDVDNYFKVENGVLTVYESGLYYVYAQVCYNNTHDQNGFVIFHGHKPFLQCLNTVPTNMPHKIHTCHTSGLIFLKENETIHLRDFHSDRNAILKDANNRSYFGLIKI